MLSGFNTNFRYRGVLFHVQTEDSGRENPHVITHLFHGGNIIASEKRKYDELLTDEDHEEPLRKLMEGQHKSMLKQLSRGEHDTAIAERLGEEVFLATSDTTDPTVPPAITEEEPAPAPVASMPSVVAETTALAGADGESLLEPEFAPEGQSGQSEKPENPPPPNRLSRVFGDRVVSEKPLDEVVLDYLVENARKRKRPPK